MQIAVLACATVVALAGARNAGALTINGTVSNQKYLLTGSAVKVTANAVLKISFETTSAGDNLSLCAGSIAEFARWHLRHTTERLRRTGFRFLTILDAASLNGKQLYILKNVGINLASFTFTIE